MSESTIKTLELAKGQAPSDEGRRFENIIAFQRRLSNHADAILQPSAGKLSSQDDSKAIVRDTGA